MAAWIRDGYEFDLIDAHYYYPDGVAAALLSRWFDKPLVVTGRGSDLNLLPEFAVPRRWIKWAESQAAKSITVSRALKSRLLELGATDERVQVLRNGVDLNMFRILDRAECRNELGLRGGRWILSVGNLIQSKGHEIAVRALLELPEDVNLAIIGDGDNRDRLRELIVELGLTDRTQLIGTVSQPDLAIWYNAVDSLVLCSTREGMPNVVLEALACGTPVVATSVGGIPEVIDNRIAGRLLEERSAPALSTALIDIMSNTVDRSEIRDQVSQFGWEKTTQGQIDLFRTIIQNQRNQVPRVEFE